MRADVARFWTTFRIVILLAMVAGVLSYTAGLLLSDGLGETRSAHNLRDFGVVANVTGVRIHVSQSREASAMNPGSGSSGASSLGETGGYSIDEVEVVFTDPQGQTQHEGLASFFVRGSTPKTVGWTSQFEGHDTFVGKEVLYLPNQARQALMRDQMQAIIDDGFEPAPTYSGIGLAVLALFGWVGSAAVANGKLRPWVAARRHRLSGIA
jgi:hypothetical protein